MSTTVMCSGCQSRLTVRDYAVTPYVTCPRCLRAAENPVARSADAVVRCGRCQRAHPQHLRQCPACGARSGAAAGTVVGGSLCAVCAEEAPGHGANCPAAELRAPPAQRWTVATADQDAERDGSATRSLGWVLIVVLCAGGVAVLGFALATFIGVMLSLIYGVATRKGAFDGLTGVATVFILTFLGVALFFGSLVLACSGRHYPA